MKNNNHKLLPLAIINVTYFIENIRISLTEKAEMTTNSQ